MLENQSSDITGFYKSTWNSKWCYLCCGAVNFKIQKRELKNVTKQYVFHLHFLNLPSKQYFQTQISLKTLMALFYFLKKPPFLKFKYFLQLAIKAVCNSEEIIKCYVDTNINASILYYLSQMGCHLQTEFYLLLFSFTE